MERKGPPDTAAQIIDRQLHRKEDDRESVTSTNGSEINCNPDDEAVSSCKNQEK